MKYIYLFILVAIASCKSSEKVTMQVCSLGIDSVTYDSTHKAELLSKKPRRNDTVVINPTNPTSLPVIYLDIDGDTVRNTRWNYQGDIICAPAGLDSTAIRLIYENVVEDLAPWYVTVTTSEAVFNAAPVRSRQKIILTTSTPLGLSAGQSFVNSFGTGDPGFVFTLLNVTIKKNKEATSHEIGHTLGLYHQSQYNDQGLKVAEYLMGVIMGNGYYVDKPWWHSGRDSRGIFVVEMSVVDKKLKRK